MPRMYSSLIVCCLLFLCGTSTAQTWDALLRRAEILAAQQMTDSAIVIGRLAIAEAEKLQTPDTTVAFLFTKLGGYYHKIGAYVSAESAYTEALARCEKTLQPNSSGIASALANLGFVHIKTGRVDKAESLLTKSLTIRKELFGPIHPKVGNTLGLLGVVSFYRERHEESRERYNQALEILEQTLGPDHEEVAAVLDNLTVLHYARLELPLGIETGERALRIREHVFGLTSDEVAETLNKLGLLHIELVQFEKAEQELQRAIRIHEALFGKEYFRLANPLNNLADLYLRQGRFNDAIGPFARARTIAIRRLGIRSAPATVISGNLAIAYVETKRFAEAEQLLRETIDNTQGLSDKFYSLQSLARLYSSQRRFSEADSVFRLILGIALEGTPDHENISGTRMLYSQMLQAKRDHAAAWEMARQAFLTRSKNFFEDSYTLTERERLTYATLSLEAATQAVSSYSMIERKSPLQAVECAEVILSSKGIVTEAVASSEHDTSAAVAKLSQNYRAAKTQLAKTYVLIERSRGDTTLQAARDSLEHIMHELEVALSKNSHEFHLRKLNARISPDTLAQYLPPRSALVEYFRTDFHQRPTPDTTVRTAKYFAVVIGPTRKLDIVDLGLAQPIDDQIQLLRKHIGKFESGRTSLTSIVQKEYTELATELYRMIWTPLGLRSEVDSTVLVAPDGSLNLLSFGGLIGSDKKYLIENHKIHYLSAGRDLLRLRKTHDPNGEHLIAFGDPDYNAPAAARIITNRIFASNSSSGTRSQVRNVRSNCEALGNLKVSRLPGSRKEVNGLSGSWREGRNTSDVYLDARASEENFKLHAPGKRFIHIATHGYFLSGVCQSQSGTRSNSFLREHPLLQSGLLLAGANVRNTTPNSDDAEDGILTALEVSSMDLRGADLVVLSACETGLGKVEQGEGVYGLRRAFQMAGAKTVVSSLWKVPDKETMQFMKTLYSTKAKTYPELMQQVALKRIREARLRGRPTHPFTWGAFVATGDWRITY